MGFVLIIFWIIICKVDFCWEFPEIVILVLKISKFKKNFS